MSDGGRGEPLPDVGRLAVGLGQRYSRNSACLSKMLEGSAVVLEGFGAAFPYTREIESRRWG